MISIIIPVYNQADKIDKCLDSIKNQTYTNYEIIIVNDGSTDNISDVLNNCKNKFEKINIINQENSGANVARNRGAQEAIGEYIIFCDADLVLRKDALDLMLKTLKENSDVSYVYPSHKFGKKLFKLWEFNAEKLKQMPYIHTTALIRKEHFPGFDENIKRFQDWDLWLTMLENNYRGKWIPEVLFTIIDTNATMSSWLPSFAYKLFPFLPKVKKYKEAMNIIKRKHRIK
ncbi:glycosyltransferase family 2 protein [Candidatus Parcubacteria bacterium]|nr:glycosyltransferase family 2 protein [Candidatus Parcubacteria bacterium]